MGALHDPESPSLFASATSHHDDLELMLRQLLVQEEDNREFVKQIARHEPLPAILKGLANALERAMPEWRACFVMVREERVQLAVAPSLGEEFVIAAAQGGFQLWEELAEAHRPMASLGGPVVRNLEQDSAWAFHTRIAADVGLRSVWATQIQFGDGSIGMLLAYSCLEARPTAVNARSMQAVADKAAIAVEHQELLERRAYQAMHDPLTGLANRALLEDRFQNALSRAKRSGGVVGLFLIDLDRFKFINDTLGHQSGDEVLRQIGARLSANLRTSDTVARIGADEFAMIAPDLPDRESAVIVAQKLLGLVAEASWVGGRELITTASVGIALFPDDGAEAAGLQQAADRALARAKLLGRNRFAYFEPAMIRAPVERMELEIEGELRNAIKNDELALHYQPQVNAQGKLVGVEALLRWKNPRLGSVSPAQFIPVAEQTGLIIPIGEWVLRTACRKLGSWHSRRDWRQVRMAINVSALQFAQPGFLPVVSEALAESDVDPRSVELELTESLLMQNTQDAAIKLSALRHLGVTAAIDDFGTGYSSLAYLRRLPIDTLKIDRSFIADIASAAGDDSATAVVRAILSMARSLGLCVVAEGVENELQRDFLVANGCNFMQGYFFGRPQTAEEIEKTFASPAHPPQRPANFLAGSA